MAADRLTEADAAQYLQVCTRTLQRMRKRGAGPVFLRVGRKISYPVADLEQWLAAQRSDAHA